MKSINTLDSYSLRRHDDGGYLEKDLVLVISQPTSFVNDRVVLTIKNTKTGTDIGEITVLAKELKKAVDNSTNCYRYS